MEGMLERRLRLVAEMLDQAAAELESSILELQKRNGIEVNHERPPQPDTGRDR